jgi:curved DNA-binding protein CbpA
MGQTPSRDKQYYDMYNSYLQQQQELISKQQGQINSLYQMNIDTQQFNQPQLNQSQLNQQIPPNLLFQQNNNPSPQITSDKKIKLDPYKILNIPKNYDEKTLKRAYLKAAMKSHPDRGGSKDSFQKVSIAYTLLTRKLKEENNSHDHSSLKDMSVDYYNEQSSKPSVNTKMMEKFDADLFNKIYDENRVGESFDDGYGEWMKNTAMKDQPHDKMFGDNFNKDLFNHTFEKYKSEQKSNSQQLTTYTNPKERISLKNQDALMILGQGKVSDFGGTTDNLSYSDYKQAFTDSTLIDTSSVDISSRKASIGSVKNERKNISYAMNPQDERIYSQQILEKQQAEENRIKRLQRYDNQTKDNYEKIHSLLLR